MEKNRAAMCASLARRSAMRNSRQGRRAGHGASAPARGQKASCSARLRVQDNSGDGGRGTCEAAGRAPTFCPRARTWRVSLLCGTERVRATKKRCAHRARANCLAMARRAYITHAWRWLSRHPSHLLLELSGLGDPPRSTFDHPHPILCNGHHVRPARRGQLLRARRPVPLCEQVARLPPLRPVRRGREPGRAQVPPLRRLHDDPVLRTPPSLPYL
jgi:hypothetical protein